MYKVELDTTYSGTAFTFADYDDVMNFVGHAIHNGTTCKGENIKATISVIPDEEEGGNADDE